MTSKQRKYLKGLAHHLKPVVQVGSKGLTKAIFAQIETQLEIHELIKVKLGQDIPVHKKEAGAAVVDACQVELVQVLGRTLILYKPREEEPTIKLPQDQTSLDG